MRARSTGEVENLGMLLAKADVWECEHEYRLIAQERCIAIATPHATLTTDNNYLKLPETALLSVIVGCQGPYDVVQSLVAEVAPEVTVKRAERVPNRFKLRIE